MRDLSKTQFQAKLCKYGFKPTGFMGYVTLPEPHSNVSVCRYNGGPRLRGQLAYLIGELTRRENEQT